MMTYDRSSPTTKIESETIPESCETQIETGTHFGLGQGNRGALVHKAPAFYVMLRTVQYSGERARVMPPNLLGQALQAFLVQLLSLGVIATAVQKVR